MTQTREIEIGEETYQKLRALSRPDESVPDLLDLWVRGLDPRAKEMWGRLGRCPECDALNSSTTCWRCGVEVNLDAHRP